MIRKVKTRRYRPYSRLERLSARERGRALHTQRLSRGGVDGSHARQRRDALLRRDAVQGDARDDIRRARGGSLRAQRVFREVRRLRRRRGVVRRTRVGEHRVDVFSQRTSVHRFADERLDALHQVDAREGSQTKLTIAQYREAILLSDPDTFEGGVL